MNHDFGEGADPIALFAAWLADAEASEPSDANAMALATEGDDGLPDVRMVLLKGHDARGFIFYTNRDSVKGRELAASPVAALCFHWKSLRRQVRVRGRVEEVTAAEADAYFQSRHRLSRIGAWASAQSRPLDSRAVLEEAVLSWTERFGDDDIPRPDYWTGYRVIPASIEFWHDGEFRLHDRYRFTPTEDGGWESQRLYP